MARGLGKETAAWMDIMLPWIAERKPISVRGVAYVAFVNGQLRSMVKNETDKVSTRLTIARESGVLPWEWIVDPTRPIEQEANGNDPDDFLDSVIPQYRKDYWRSQPERLLVISEKATVAGIVAPVLEQYGVGFTIMHGFGSATAVKGLAKLSASDSRPLTLIYIGDHDPSGAYMSEVDLPERLARYDGASELVRVAVLPAHLAAYGLPTFPVASKQGDSRHNWFVRTHGRVCAELDAMDPRILRGLLEREIAWRIDGEAWDLAVSTEVAEEVSLRDVLTAWRDLKSG